MSETADDLKKEFNTRFPKLDVVAARFFELEDKAVIKKNALKGQFPFPVFRANRTGIKSQSSPYLVDVEDLAKYLDEQAMIARERGI